MRILASVVVLGLGLLISADGLAQAPGMPNMAAMQETQQKYDAMKAERKAERQQIEQQIVEEELAKARANVTPGIDPMSVAERATKARMEPLKQQWQQEDAALDTQMQQEMMQMLYSPEQMQMLQQYGMPMPTPQE